MFSICNLTVGYFSMSVRVVLCEHLFVDLNNKFLFRHDYSLIIKSFNLQIMHEVCFEMCPADAMLSKRNKRCSHLSRGVLEWTIGYSRQA